MATNFSDPKLFVKKWQSSFTIDKSFVFCHLSQINIIILSINMVFLAESSLLWVIV